MVQFAWSSAEVGRTDSSNSNKRVCDQKSVCDTQPTHPWCVVNSLGQSFPQLLPRGISENEDLEGERDTDRDRQSGEVLTDTKRWRLIMGGVHDDHVDVHLHD